DAGVNLLLEIELFRHRLDNEVGRRYAFAAEVGDQPVERIAYLAAIVATDLAVEVGSALDCAGQGLGLHVRKTDDKSVPRTPGGDIATHRARADDVNARAVPFAAGHAFELIAEEKHAYKILRRFGDQQARERRDFRRLHCRGVAAVLLPQVDQR